ncbi:MAG: hypothetical protein V4496_04350 [Pseudomonadota bacterium]
MPITIKKIFHTTRDVTKTTWSNTPSADVDYIRMIKGQKPFKSSAITQTMVKQTLIIAENIRNYLENIVEVKKFDDCIKQLYQEGFSIYFCKGKKLHLYTHAFLKNLSALPRHSDNTIHYSLTPKEISEQLNISIEEILQFDFPEISLLSSGCEGTFDGTTLTTWKNQETLRSIKLTTSSLTHMNELMNICPNIVLFSINANEIIEFSCNKNTIQKWIDFFQKHQPPEEMLTACSSEATTLTLNSNFVCNSDFLLSILEKASQIEVLNLDGFTLDDLTLDDLQPLNNADLSKLKTLGLWSSSFSGDFTAAILAKTSQLEALMAYDCNILEDIQLPDHVDLSKLKILDLSEFSVSSDFVEAILAKTSELEILALTFCSTLTDIQLSDHVDLSKLKILNLSGSSVSSDFVATILAKAPQLETLNLSRCRTLEELELSDHADLSKLKILDLSCSYVSSDFVAAILAKTPQLETLNLNRCQNLEELELSDHADLSKLKIVDLSGSSVSSDFVAAILAKSSHLEELCLLSCKNLTEEDIEDFRQEQKQLSISFQLYKENEITSHQKSSTTQQKSIDADTRPSNQTLRTDRVFMGMSRAPEPRELRYEVFDNLQLNTKPDINAPFLLNHSALMSFFAITPIQAQRPLLLDYQMTNDHYYFGRKKLRLTSEWQALPSIFPNEVLLYFYLSSPADVEFIRSTNTDLQYIRLKGSQPPQNNTIELFLGGEKAKLSWTELPTEVRSLIKFCRNFKAGALRNIDETSSAQQYMSALITQKLGACRHRSVVFKYLMQQNHPNIPVRLVANDIHMYAEVFYQQQWIPCDFGGYPAKIKIREKLSERVTQNSEQKTQTKEITKKLPPHYFIKRESSMVIKKSAAEILTHSGTTCVHTSNGEDTRLALQKTAHTLGQTPYFIDSPDVLRCAGPYIQRDAANNTLGHIVKDPGGPLYEFFTSDAPHKVLIIDYSQFTPAEIVATNAVLDNPPRVDGIWPSSHIHVIALLNPHNSAMYQGPDFYSRFDRVEEMTHELTPAFSPPIPLAERTHSNSEIIELCGGEHWESCLIGHWTIQGNYFVFKEGVLLQALKHNRTTVAFNNAPLHDPAFVVFLHDLSWYRAVYYQGHNYGALPEIFSFELTQGVYLPEKEKYLQLYPENALIKGHQLLLNQANISDFLVSYTIQQGQLHTQAGLIERYKNNKLPIYLTSSLSFYTWLRLLEACREHNTTLLLTLAPGVTLPKELEMDTDHLATRPSLALSPRTIFNPLSIPQDLNTMTIDITELETNAFLATFKFKEFNRQTNIYEFALIENAIQSALEKNKTVILKGRWTLAIAEAVQTLIFQRWQNACSGKLVILCDHPSLFPFLPSQALNELPKATPRPDKIVDYAERFSEVEAALATTPFVRITGPSGCGKTHFVVYEWTRKHPKLHYGEEKILAFLEDTSTDGLIILYLNEANLNEKQWALFMGLFDNPPAVFYKNHYYPVTSRHKVIVDGNPLSCGGGRNTPYLFQQHPYQLLFQPLPREVIAKHIDLEPALKEPILDVVAYLASCDPNDTLLTPREIKAMANFIRIAQYQYPHISGQTLARYFAYTLSQPHVPYEHRAAFEEKFKTDMPFTLADVIAQNNSPGDYILHETNLPVAIAIHMHLARREYYQTTGATPLAVGLNGLIIEGESGEGKSTLIIHQLQLKGYQEGVDFIHIAPKTKGLEATLLNAFHQGQMVVIDEINTHPLDEKLLLALLEGHDLKGNLPEKPGFLLFGTQNPLSYRGRLKLSTPLAHRVQTITLQKSTLQEKRQILDRFELPTDITQYMLQEWAQNTDLTLRDLLKAAEQWKACNQPLSRSSSTFFSNKDAGTVLGKRKEPEPPLFELNSANPHDHVDFLPR